MIESHKGLKKGSASAHCYLLDTAQIISGALDYLGGLSFEELKGNQINSLETSKLLLAQQHLTSQLLSRLIWDFKSSTDSGIVFQTESVETLEEELGLQLIIDVINRINPSITYSDSHIGEKIIYSGTLLQIFNPVYKLNTPKHSIKLNFTSYKFFEGFIDTFDMIINNDSIDDKLENLTYYMNKIKKIKKKAFS